jgi:hypothetical protein
MIGISVQVILATCGSAFSAERDLDPPDLESDGPNQNQMTQIQGHESVPQFDEPFQRFDDLFPGVSPPFFSRSIASRRPVLKRPEKQLLFQLINHEIPPSPATPEAEITPADMSYQPLMVDSPPLQLTPTPIECDSNECDQCESCDPIFGGIIKQNCCHEVENWSPIVRFFGVASSPNPELCSDFGIGHERVVFAPFEIDVTQPNNYTTLRWDSGFGLQTPDRAEYFWSSPGKGPAVSPNSINYQDLRLVNEVASDSVSLQTDIPVRFIEPYAGGSTSGLGDIRMAMKARLINGQKWQISQIFRTYIPTGVATKGVGTGHVSLEPGILARYQISPATFVHGEVKYWIPIAADQGFAGNVLTYGVGISHVLYETNNFAVLPDLELVNYDFLMGSKTLNGVAVGSAGETTYNIVPGARFVMGPKGDLGLFEFGVSNMIGIGGDRYIDNLLRFDFKFVY